MQENTVFLCLFNCLELLCILVLQISFVNTTVMALLAAGSFRFYH